mgnify:FL=1
MVIDNGIANSTGSDFRSLPVLLLLKLDFKSYGMTCKEQMPAERHREIQCSCLEASISVALLRKGEHHGECTDIVNIFRATPRN